MRDVEFSDSPPRPRWLRFALGYGLMIAATVVVFVVICTYGEATSTDVVRETYSPRPQGAPRIDVLLHVLATLAAVLVAGRVMSWILSSIQQPAVIGEIIAGILLGPSLLGPQYSRILLPEEAAPFLGVVAQLGIALYMFTVGLQLNQGTLRRWVHVTVAMSHASIVVPFLLGGALALVLYPELAGPQVRFTPFALFLGVAMSITAFPVLARILTDRKLVHTELGAVALTCAATDDVTAWCLLAVIVSLAGVQAGHAATVLAGAGSFLLLMFTVVRPLLRRYGTVWEGDAVSRDALTLIFIGLLTSALAAELAGLHAIFGAFLLGAMIPHGRATEALTRQLEQVATVFLLPAFFAFTGMRTRIDLISGWEAWLVCGVIVLIATLGKFGGTMIAGRLGGLGWRQAAAIGTLMNTRGLMELVVLNIGLDIGVISSSLFSMMVVMAVVTTMATGPVLEWLIARRPTGVTDDVVVRELSHLGTPVG